MSNWHFCFDSDYQQGLRIERICLRHANACMTQRVPFDCNGTMFGGYDKHGDYIVYSYGDHWPLYYWNEELQRGFVNRDKSSRTTSRHLSKLAPRGDTMSVHDMAVCLNSPKHLRKLWCTLGRDGFAQYMAMRRACGYTYPTKEELEGT